MKIRILSLTLAAISVLFFGCSKKLDGEYVYKQRIPSYGAEYDKLLNGAQKEQLRSLNSTMQSMGTMSLKFEGSKVLWKTATSTTECDYRIEGDTLELFRKSNGYEDRTEFKMLEDGSLSYAGLVFRKKE